MAYTVNKTNSSASVSAYTVQDSVLNTQTDLSFIGKGYAGYGETVAENFLHLLENFSNTSAPSKPITGQLWYDETNNKLKVYDGSFKPVSGAEYQSSAPTSQQQGDLWIDSDTQQLYFYNGTSNVLVGPPASGGTTNGFVYNTIAGSTDVNQNVTYWYNDGNLIAIISEDTFTPKSAITGFATITKGITLSTAISDLKFAGNATDADKLGGVAAANYLRSNANDTTSGTLAVLNDGGLIVGSDSDVTITVDSSGGIIANTVQDTDITFKVNDGGSTTTVMTIDGSEARVGIGTTTSGQILSINPLAEDRFFVATSGGVGIKTTLLAPTVELDVYGDIKSHSVAIGDTGRSAIDFSAAVSVEGANRNTLAYMIIPRLTTTQRNALRDAHNQGSSILNGAMIYNTTDNEFQVRKGGAWVNLSTS